MSAEKKMSVADQAMETLREKILAGEYRPGDKLPPEVALTEILGVGRSTVREAVRTLQAMGYVELKPGSGAFVAEDNLRDRAENWFTVNEDTLVDFRSLRWMVEPESAALAAACRTEKDMAVLQALTDRFSEESHRYAASGDRGLTPQLTRLDQQFHTLLLRSSGNMLLTQMYGQIAPLFRQYSIRAFTLRPSSADQTAREHRRIADAVLAGDADGAREAMRAHLTAAGELMEGYARGSKK